MIDAKSRLNDALEAVRTSLDRTITPQDRSLVGALSQQGKRGRHALADKRAVDRMTCGASHQLRHANYCQSKGQPWAAVLHRSAAAALAVPALTTAVPLGLYMSFAGGSKKERTDTFIVEQRVQTDVANLVGCLQQPPVHEAVQKGADLGVLWTEYRSVADEIEALRQRCRASKAPRLRTLETPFGAAKRSLSRHEKSLELALRAVDVARRQAPSERSPA